jgi:hypothetical protein
LKAPSWAGTAWRDPAAISRATRWRRSDYSLQLFPVIPIGHGERDLDFAWVWRRRHLLVHELLQKINTNVTKTSQPNPQAAPLNS